MDGMKLSEQLSGPEGKLTRELKSRGYLLPLGRRQDDKLTFARPEIVDDLMAALMLPGDVYAGRVAPMSQEAIERGFDLAGTVTLGAGAVPMKAGQNVLRMGAKGLTSDAFGEGGIRPQALGSVAREMLSEFKARGYKNTSSEYAGTGSQYMWAVSPEGHQVKIRFSTHPSGIKRGDNYRPFDEITDLGDGRQRRVFDVDTSSYEAMLHDMSRLRAALGFVE